MLTMTGNYRREEKTGGIGRINVEIIIVKENNNEIAIVNSEQKKAIEKLSMV